MLTSVREKGDKYTEEGKWIMQEWTKAMGVLYESQKRAGNSMHFDKEFSNIKEGAPSWMRDDLQDNAWRLYTDGSWEIGDVTTDEGLREALRTIEASGDSGLVGTHDYRSADQRDYLANKAYVRYLNAKLEAFGLADVKNAFNDPYKIFRTIGRSKDGAKQAVAKMQLGDKTFGFSPDYSFADDYEKWGYHTKPSEISFEQQDYMNPDYAIPEDKLVYYQRQPNWLQEFSQYYDGDFNPDEVAGRFKNQEDFDAAMHIVSGGVVVTGPRTAAPIIVPPMQDAPEVAEQPEQIDPVEVLPEPEKPAPPVGNWWDDFLHETEKEIAKQQPDAGAAGTDVVHTIDPVETKPQTVPDAAPEAGSHVHEEVQEAESGPPLPVYMQQQHEDRVFQHSSAPMHLPPAHTKVV